MPEVKKIRRYRPTLLPAWLPRVRVSEEMLLRLRRHAAARGLQVGDYVRRAIELQLTLDDNAEPGRPDGK